MQPTAGCIAIFLKYCCYIKNWCIITNLLHEIIGGILAICQSATVRVCGAWIRIYYVLCSKSYSIFGGLFWILSGLAQAVRVAHIRETDLLPGNFPRYPIWGALIMQKSEVGPEELIPLEEDYCLHHDNRI